MTPEILAALKGARARILELEGRTNEPIAIVGRACRFPGAETLDAFAAAARSGRTAIAAVPPERWWGARPTDPAFIAWAGMLDDPWRFDAEAFGIPAAEADAMDPQQRLALELAAEALDRAGWDREACAGLAAGVFLGVCNNDYAQRFLTRDPDRNDAWVGTGNAWSVASGRIAYALGLRGPALTIDTACSSSLVAVHVACQSLRARDCDVALAGGVNLLLLPAASMLFGRMGFLSRSGAVRPFDARADGYVRGEGGGVVVLRRLSDAVAAGDPILAVIRGSAINQNGHRNGIVAPNRHAQEAVLRAALAMARVEPSDVGYVEAMGVAAPLADLVEAGAIASVYGAGRAVPVASVKGLFGHCEAAGGVASLLRAVDAVSAGYLPPTAGFSSAASDLAGVAPRAEAGAWEGGRRTAGVSAFGFSGTNAHVVVSEAPSEGASARRPQRTIRPWGGKRHRIDVDPPGGVGIDPPRAAAPTDLPAPLLDVLVAEVGAVLGRPVHAEAPLVELGLDSLGAVELVRRVQEKAGILLYPSQLLGAATLRRLAEALAMPRPSRAGAREAFLAARTRLPTHRWEARDEAPMAASPVFLLSPPRVGSTLLRVLLAGHPRLFAPPELHLLPFADLYERRERLRDNLLDAGLVQALVGAGLGPDEARAKAEAWADDRRPITDAYAALFDTGRILVDKSPSYGFDPAVLRRAETLFRAPRYLLLTRHPAAARASFARLRLGQLFDLPSGLAEGEAAWEVAMANLDAHAATLPRGRVHRVRHEDLLRDPERVLAGITRWLGIGWSDAMFAPWAGDPARMAGDLGFVGDPGFRLRGRVDPTVRSPFSPEDPPLQPETARRAWEWGYTPDPTTSALVAATGRQVTHGVLVEKPEAAAPAERFPVTTTARESILLTGATGFLGPWLLRALLRRHAGPVEVLVRAPDRDAAHARVARALAAIGAGDLADRVIAHPGDLAAPGLGLRDRAGIRARVGRVVHSGALVSFVQPWDALAPANVDGTRSVLELCRDAGVPLLHVSTKGVYGPGMFPGTDPVPEDASVPPPYASGSGYQDAKWVAEALVAASDVPAAWVRVGRIGGDTRTGKAPEDDLFVRFVRACAEVGTAPDLPGSFEVLPVDVVADVLASLALDDARGPWLLVHPEPRRLAHLVEALPGDVPIEPYSAWRARLVGRLRAGGGALDPLLSLFPEEPPSRLDDARLVPARLLARGFAPEPVAVTLGRMFGAS